MGRRQGRIVTRGLERRDLPSLDRDSVLEFATWYADFVEDRERRRREREEYRVAVGPPDQEHRWLTPVGAAAVLGIHVSRVRQLVKSGKLPHVRRQHRVWFRLDHLLRFDAGRGLSAPPDTLPR